MLLIYPGPSEAVFVPALDAEAVRGKPIDVPEVIAQSLIDQGWTEPKKVDAAKSVAKKSTTNPPQEG